MARQRVRLIHWNRAEAAPRIEALRAAGYEVAYDGEMSKDLLREMRERPPAAVVIDLTRLPSHGRDVALAVRQSKAMRRVPLVFAEGDPGKVERVRKLLPDAVYTSWGRIRRALRQAIANPPENPVIPASLLDGYSGTPLPRKLGIRPGSVVALAGAPDGFCQQLQPLPEGAEVRDSGGDVTLWFVRSRRQLELGLPRMAGAAGRGPLWIIWPKKASGAGTDLTQQEVRKAGLAAGLVDYKICAVDAIWSGLAFRLRKAKSATAPPGASNTRPKRTARG